MELTEEDVIHSNFECWIIFRICLNLTDSQLFVVNLPVMCLIARIHVLGFWRANLIS
jgi:hypothetical protein